MTNTIICIAEDRPSEQIAVKLLVLSLTEHCSKINIILFFPPATDDFKDWIAQFQHVELRTSSIAGGYGWNVKPQALLSLFEEGRDEIWWIDSDIILTCDFRRNLEMLSQSTFVVCEEALCAANVEDSGQRAKNWKLDFNRSFPFALNSGVIRVTRTHIPLLKKWKELLESEIYKQAQQKPGNERPIHMLSDQDVLTALLSSREFSWIPIKLLTKGKDIIQYLGPAGYTVTERVRNLFTGLPPFIHAQGFKPWRFLQQQDFLQAGLRRYYIPLLMELSPYNYIANQYKNQVNETTIWLYRSSRLGTFFKILGLGQPCLTGLPISIAYSVWNFFKRRINQ